MASPILMGEVPRRGGGGRARKAHLDPGGPQVADGAGEVRLASPQLGVAPGQAAVCYQGDRMLGGGWIAETASSGELYAGYRGIPEPARSELGSLASIVQFAATGD